VDRQTLTYVQQLLREKLKTRLFEQGPMNIEQIEEMFSKEISTTLAGLVGKETVAIVSCDRQGRITVSVKLPDWIVKFMDVNNKDSYDVVDPAEKTTEEMMSEGEVGEELDGHAS
jgi:hypothetical protein